MSGIFNALAGAFGAFTRLWDWFMSPAKRKARARAEVDKVIAEHDEGKANEILDRNLP